MCGVGKKQIHDMSLRNESSAALQRTPGICEVVGGFIRPTPHNRKLGFAKLLRIYSSATI